MSEFDVADSYENADRSRYVLGDYVGHFVRVHFRTPAWGCYCAEGKMRPLSTDGRVVIDVIEPDPRDDLSFYSASIESVMVVEFLDRLELDGQDTEWRCDCECPKITVDEFSMMHTGDDVSLANGAAGLSRLNPNPNS